MNAQPQSIEGTPQFTRMANRTSMEPRMKRLYFTLTALPLTSRTAHLSRNAVKNENRYRAPGLAASSWRTPFGPAWDSEDGAVP